MQKEQYWKDSFEHTGQKIETFIWRVYNKGNPVFNRGIWSPLSKLQDLHLLSILRLSMSC